MTINSNSQPTANLKQLSTKLRMSQPRLCPRLRMHAAPARALEPQRQPKPLPPRGMPHIAAVPLVVLVAVSLLVRVVVAWHRHQIPLLYELWAPS